MEYNKCMKYTAVLFDWGDTLSHHGVKSFVPSLFRRLYNQGYRLGILSNADRYGDARWLRREMATQGMIEFVECVMSTGAALGEITAAGSGGCHKPNPEAFYRILSFLNVPANEAVYVGDSFKNDILATASLGMASLHVRPDENWNGRLWSLLEDSLACPRLNVLTAYAFIEPNVIRCKMRHLSEPISQTERIMVGRTEYSVVDVSPTEQDKEHIVHGSEDVYMTITIAPIDD